MRLTFSFINLDMGVLGPIPFQWDIKMEYTKIGGECRLVMTLDKQIYYTSSLGKASIPRLSLSLIHLAGVLTANILGLETQNLFTIFNVITFILAFISFIFSIKGFFSNVFTFMVSNYYPHCSRLKQKQDADIKFFRELKDGMRLFQSK